MICLFLKTLENLINLFFLGWILVYVNTIWLHGQNWVSHTIPCGLSFPPRCALSCTPFVLICFSLLSFLSHSFSFILWSTGTAISKILQVPFLVDYYKVWYSGRDWVIRLKSKSYKSMCVCMRARACVRACVCVCVCVFPRDSNWVLHIPFVPMVKFRFLAHLPADHFTHPVVSRLTLFLC